jgi:hypothetical protein
MLTFCSNLGSLLLAFALQGEVTGGTRTWDFDTDDLGKVPARWTAEYPRQDPPAAWTVALEIGRLDNQVLSQTAVELASDQGKRQFKLCIADVSYLEVDAKVRVRARSGKIDQGGGIVWRYQDPRNYYLCRWNPLENSLRAYKVVDGLRSQTDSAKVPGALNEWHTLRIVQFGRDLRAYFDGHLLLEVEDDQFPHAGRIGLWTKADALTEFDDLTVQVATEASLEEPAVEPLSD